MKKLDKLIVKTNAIAPSKTAIAACSTSILLTSDRCSLDKHSVNRRSRFPKQRSLLTRQEFCQQAIAPSQTAIAAYSTSILLTSDRTFPNSDSPLTRRYAIASSKTAIALLTQKAIAAHSTSILLTDDRVRSIK
jgi:hypothetical protein